MLFQNRHHHITIAYPSLVEKHQERLFQEFVDRATFPQNSQWANCSELAEIWPDYAQTVEFPGLRLGEAQANQLQKKGDAVNNIFLSKYLVWFEFNKLRLLCYDWSQSDSVGQVKRTDIGLESRSGFFAQ